jgi:hypothetical protein
MGTETERGLRWRLPVYLAIITLIVTAILGVVSGLFVLLSFMLLTLPCIAALLCFLFASAFRKEWRRVLLVATVLAGYLWCSIEQGRSGLDLRCAARWAWCSRQLKEEVVSLPQPPAGGLSHILWEDFGGMGAHTQMYLVFSPDDRLRRYSPGDLSGLPCEVWKVHRLEKQWYMVKLYSNDRWDSCGVKAAEG